jgi:hypothetical protein
MERFEVEMESESTVFAQLYFGGLDYLTSFPQSSRASLFEDSLSGAVAFPLSPSGVQTRNPYSGVDDGTDHEFDDITAEPEKNNRVISLPQQSNVEGPIEPLMAANVR